MSFGGFNDVAVVFIPSLNQGASDMSWLISMREMALTKKHIIFDFRSCRFLGPAAVVIIGSTCRDFSSRGITYDILWNSLDRKVLMNLLQNGFAKKMGFPGNPWAGHSIPYREDCENSDIDEIISHLYENWLNPAWIKFSPPLRNAIVGRVWEMYANAFEHSDSKNGVISCGQHFHSKKELFLCVVDFGTGIPIKIRNYQGSVGPSRSMSDSQCLEWAFQSGNSTATLAGIPRGLGLDLLREFVQINQGALEIYSGYGRALVDGVNFKFQDSPKFFPGTLVQLKIVCDERTYKFKSEDF